MTGARQVDQCPSRKPCQMSVTLTFDLDPARRRRSNSCMAVSSSALSRRAAQITGSLRRSSTQAAAAVRVSSSPSITLSLQCRLDLSSIDGSTMLASTYIWLIDTRSLGSQDLDVSFTCLIWTSLIRHTLHVLAPKVNTQHSSSFIPCDRVKQDQWKLNAFRPLTSDQQGTQLASCGVSCRATFYWWKRKLAGNGAQHTDKASLPCNSSPHATGCLPITHDPLESGCTASDNNRQARLRANSNRADINWPLIPCCLGGHGGVMVRPLASHQGEPGSITGGVVSGFPACGNRARRCRWSAGFLWDLPFPPPSSQTCPLHSRDWSCTLSLVYYWLSVLQEVSNKSRSNCRSIRLFTALPHTRTVEHLPSRLVLLRCRQRRGVAAEVAECVVWRKAAPSASHPCQYAESSTTGPLELGFLVICNCIEMNRGVISKSVYSLGTGRMENGTGGIRARKRESSADDAVARVNSFPALSSRGRGRGA
ncbi:hypothetical protein PR048_014865 [Dryococelus australis]|uniref:Uncharacterized protein n=1 Tax=Dryococelus australis TaxID=614101 RepID=A0ABQ9HFT5_9NEOP|nr:hypothetical protein PR048_014865 [Dryococelus australis]